MENSRKLIWNCMRTVLLEESKLIEQALVLAVENNNLSGKVRRTQGKSSPKSKDKNDRSLFYWIIYEDAGFENWITLFYNDIDANTCNPHSQIGRIQFWKEIEKRHKNENSPHNGSKVGNDYNLNFMLSKSGDPQMFIYDDSYDREKLVAQFIEFVMGQSK